MRAWRPAISSWLSYWVSGLGICATLFSAASANEELDWRKDWDVAPDFELSIDAAGFQLPSAIAFVPEPGPGPKDPLYFVTELRGGIKVVTNDRTVLTFVENVGPTGPKKELPDMQGETGLAGIVLEPEHGYVFVSFAYAGADGILRNDIARFSTKPNTFAVNAGERLSFTEILKPFPSEISHQIGPMVVDKGALYVSVGDAMQPRTSQQLDSPGGKILRMTLDGQPLPDNPFFNKDDPDTIRNYIWCYGLRNPFSLTKAHDRLFLMDNGPAIDRFTEVIRGWNYGYDGTDWSIGVSSQYTFYPSVGTAQMTFVGDDPLYPDILRERFIAALAGSPTNPPGPPKNGSKSVAYFGYDFTQQRVTTVPKLLVQHSGNDKQVVASAAAHDGELYFAPLLPTSNNESAVLRLSYKSGYRAVNLIGENMSAGGLLVAKSCQSCHGAEAGKSIGPPLDRTLGARLQARLNSPEYVKQVAEIDALDDELHVRYANARREVLGAEGEQRVRLWTRYRLLEPRFDQVASGMPTLGLTERQAETLVNFLVPAKRSFLERARRASHESAYRYGAVFLGGILLGLSCAAALFYARRRRGAVS